MYYTEHKPKNKNGGGLGTRLPNRWASLYLELHYIHLLIYIRFASGVVKIVREHSMAPAGWFGGAYTPLRPPPPPPPPPVVPPLILCGSNFENAIPKSLILASLHNQLNCWFCGQTPFQTGSGTKLTIYLVVSRFYSHAQSLFGMGSGHGAKNFYVSSIS